MHIRKGNVEVISNDTGAVVVLHADNGHCTTVPMDWQTTGYALELLDAVHAAELDDGYSDDELQDMGIEVVG